MQFFKMASSERLVEQLWDLWCVCSVIGIWPRFIEPALLCTSRHTIPMPQLAKELDGLRLVHISDLHFSHHVSAHFLSRIQKRIQKLEPHIILFTGDFISYSELYAPASLAAFLSSLHAPLGCFAVLGNHDYEEYVSLDEHGAFCLFEDHTPAILRGFARLFGLKTGAQRKRVTAPIAPKRELCQLLEKSGVRLLHNETVQIGWKRARLNITGLGDLMTLQSLPFRAYHQYDVRCPGIVLSHNADTYASLRSFPGDLFLFGHTHGGQVNLPYIWERITPIRDRRLKSGLFHIHNHFLYVNRGLGATFPFRWFSPPEIALITLTRAGLSKSVSWLASPLGEPLLEPKSC